MGRSGLPVDVARAGPSVSNRRCRPRDEGRDVSFFQQASAVFWSAAWITPVAGATPTGSTPTFRGLTMATTQRRSRSRLIKGQRPRGLAGWLRPHLRLEQLEDRLAPAT